MNDFPAAAAAAAADAARRSLAIVEHAACEPELSPLDYLLVRPLLVPLRAALKQRLADLDATDAALDRMFDALNPVVIEAALEIGARAFAAGERVLASPAVERAAR